MENSPGGPWAGGLAYDPSLLRLLYTSDRQSSENGLLVFINFRQVHSTREINCEAKSVEMTGRVCGPGIRETRTGRRIWFPL